MVPFKFLFIGYFLVLLMGDCFGSLSIAEAMGKRYGKWVRKVTAVLGVFVALGMMAAQLKVGGSVLGVLLDLEGNYAMIACTLVLMIYTAFGGFNSVIATDLVQMITFGLFIPILALIIYFDLPQGASSITKAFQEKSILHDFSGCTILPFLYILNSNLRPMFFQRIVASRDVWQARQVLLYTALGVFFLRLSVICITVLLISRDVTIDPNHMIAYIMDSYSHVGLKGLIAIGIMAMVMSTADSCNNALGVLVANDLVSSNRFSKLTIARMASLLGGMTALGVAFYTQDIFSVVLAKSFLWRSLAGSARLTTTFYVPITRTPLLLWLFGFSTTPRVVLTTMGGTALVLLGLLTKTSISNNSVSLIGMVVSIGFSMTLHYLLGEPGGWVGIKQPAPFYVLLASYKKRYNNLINDIRNFSLYRLLARNVPDEMTFLWTGGYSLMSNYLSLYLVSPEIVTNQSALFHFLSYTILIPTSLLLTHPLWYWHMPIKTVRTWFWSLAMGWLLPFMGTLLLIVSGTTKLQTSLFIGNLFTLIWCFEPILVMALGLLGMGGAVWAASWFGLSYSIDYASLSGSFIYLIAFTLLGIIAFLRNQTKKREITLKNDLLKDNQKAISEHLAHQSAFETRFAKKLDAEALNQLEGLSKEPAAKPIQARLKSFHSHLKNLAYHAQHRMQLQVQKHNLQALIEEAIEVFRLTSETELEINLHHQSKVKEIFCDAERIKQVLQASLSHFASTTQCHIETKVATLNYELDFMQAPKQLPALQIALSRKGGSISLTAPFKADISQDESLSNASEWRRNQQIIVAHYGACKISPDNHIYLLPQSLYDIRPKLEDEVDQITHGTINCVAEEFPFMQKIIQNKALDRVKIMKALNLIKRLHAGQKRKSGEPFYLHPVAVAEIVLGFSQESYMIIAALLHDVVEDSHTSLDQIELLFGQKVASLVDQLTKFGGRVNKINLSSAENQHKLTQGNQEAIKIKLADRLHNMRTIGSFRVEKQRRKAEETLMYYLPLAPLVGLPEIAEELKQMVNQVLAIKI